MLSQYRVLKNDFLLIKKQTFWIFIDFCGMVNCDTFALNNEWKWKCAVKIFHLKSLNP